jgi:hypothetical protein
MEARSEVAAVESGAKVEIHFEVTARRQEFFLQGL